MFSTKDGKKKFGSGFAAKRYDESHSEDGMHKIGETHEKQDMEGEGAKPYDTETPSEDKAESRMDENSEGKNPDADEKDDKDMHPVVREHGKAHTVHIKHHEGGKSHVMSHHPDGHTNMSEHEDAAEAHEEGKKLSGHAGFNDQEKKSPFMQGKNQQGASSEEDGFAMPDLV